MFSIFMTLKNVFNIHDPEGTKRLFQLRVGLSPLRYHKKRFKHSPSDTCICGMSVETAEHFLIYCNLYNEVRVHLFQVINPILETKHLEQYFRITRREEKKVINFIPSNSDSSDNSYSLSVPEALDSES